MAWVLEIDCGTLTLNPETMRCMTFLPPSEPKETMQRESPEATPASLRVTTIEAPNAVGLMVTGPKITRLAAATELSGDWIPIDLREPVEGRAVPDRGSRDCRLRPGPPRLRIRLRGQAMGHPGSARGYQGSPDRRPRISPGPDRRPHS